MPQTKDQSEPLQLRTLLTVSEVQAYLGIKSRKTILKYIRNGQLVAYKIGGTRWRIAREDVECFLKSQMKGNKVPAQERKLAEIVP